MSQVATFKKIEIQNEKAKVTARFRESGSILRGDKIGECLGFEIDLSLDSDAPDKIVADLMRLAHQMCFTEVALTQKVEIAISHQLNGQALKV